MKLLLKFPIYLNIRCFSKNRLEKITRNLFYGPNAPACYSTVLDTCNTNFHHLKNLSDQESQYVAGVNSKRKKLLFELFEECQFKKSPSQQRSVTLLLLNIDSLNELGLLPKTDDVVESMLSYLEPFPFVMDQRFLRGTFRKKRKRIEELKDFISVTMLRNSIEMQYLAWKFNVNFEVIERIVMYLRCCFFIGRSLQSLKTNMDLLINHHKMNKKDLPNKIYLLSQMSLHDKILDNFQDNLLGLEWFQIGICYPAILRRPYDSIISCLEALKKDGFSREQLIKAFPVLGIRPSILMKILDYFKDKSSIYPHREDHNFLRLACLYHKGKLKEYDWNEISYEDLKDLLAKEEFLNKGFSTLKKFPKKVMAFYLKVKLGATDEQLEHMKNNFKNYSFSFTGLSDTLLFLKEINLTREEIVDCITIIFYSREVIQYGLETMANDEQTLRKIGFVNGYSSTRANLFKRGSKLKNKTLHLCLYYIQRENNFSIGQDLIMESNPSDK